jgi:hypothetical protein
MNIGEEPTKKCECGEAFYFSENLAAHRDYCQKGIDAEKIRVLELQVREVERLVNECQYRRITPDDLFGKLYALFFTEKRVEEPRCSMCWSNDGGRAWIHIGVPVRACGHDCHNKDAVKR